MLESWQGRGNEDQGRSRLHVGPPCIRSLEHYLLGEKHADLTDVGQQATMMAQKVIDEGIKGSLNEIWGSEVTLWYQIYIAGADRCSRCYIMTAKA